MLNPHRQRPTCHAAPLPCLTRVAEAMLDPRHGGGGAWGGSEQEVAVGEAIEELDKGSGGGGLSLSASTSS
jgi:hypothetical protein